MPNFFIKPVKNLTAGANLIWLVLKKKQRIYTMNGECTTEGIQGTGTKTTKMCLMRTCQYATLSCAKY